MSLNIFLKQIHKIVPEFDAQIGKIKKKEKKTMALPVSQFFGSHLTGRPEMNGTHHSKEDRPRET